MDGSASGTMKLRVDRLTREATDVLSFDLVDPEGAELPGWEPGAHVEVTVSEQVRRQYSLCGDLDDRRRYRIAVLDVRDGRGGSRHIHDAWRVGDLVEVSQPRNHFALVEAAPTATFIAGGIGITPILSMLRYLDGRKIHTSLHYGGRSRDSMAFTAALDALSYCDVAIIEQDRHGLPDLESIIGSAPDDAYIYCCGPPPMIDAVSRIVQQHPTKQLRIERFSAGTGSDDPDAAAEGRAFTVQLQKTAVSVEVGEDVSILDAVRAALPEVVSSCEEGICGSCEVRVVRGSVDHRDHILTSEQRAKSETMMICVSRATSDVLVLDL